MPIFRWNQPTNLKSQVPLSLEVGRYYVFVFIDENGNGYFDHGELAQYYGHGGDFKTIDIKEKRTKFLALSLIDDIEIDLN